MKICCDLPQVAHGAFAPSWPQGKLAGENGLSAHSVCVDLCPLPSLAHPNIQQGEKPHKCELCDFTCRDVSYLSKHMLTHSSTKDYMCTECGYVTKWKHYLSVHMRKHAGDLRYEHTHASIPVPRTLYSASLLLNSTCGPIALLAPERFLLMPLSPIAWSWNLCLWSSLPGESPLGSGKGLSTWSTCLETKVSLEFSESSPGKVD